MSVSQLYACVGVVYATVIASWYFRVNSANHALCVSKLIAKVEHTYVLQVYKIFMHSLLDSITVKADKMQLITMRGGVAGTMGQGNLYNVKV